MQHLEKAISGARLTFQLALLRQLPKSVSTRGVMFQRCVDRVTMPVRIGRMAWHMVYGTGPKFRQAEFTFQGREKIQ